MSAGGAVDAQLDSGAALVTAVLFALVLLMVGHGALVFGRTQRWVAGVDGGRWAEDEGRRAALMTAAEELDSLPPAGRLGTPWGSVEIRELGPEVRLLSVEASPVAPGTGWATLLAAPHPVVRAGEREAAARVGGAVFDGGSGVRASDERCPPGLADGPVSRVGPLPDGAVEPRLGVLDFGDLLDALPGLASDRLTLPGSGPDACENAGGFGDPDRPGSCPGVWGAASRRGDLTIVGRGQGVLAVSGDLTLASEARFRGWVWVGGELRITPGAELQGLADVGGRFVVRPGGSFRPDGCAGALSLEAARVLKVPRRVGPLAWPLFRP